MGKAPSISKEDQILNYETVESLLEKNGVELNKKYELPIAIQKDNEIIISDVFYISFKYDEFFRCYELSIDMLEVKNHYQDKFNIYLIHNTNYEQFIYNETLDKLTIISEEHNVTYTIFLKRFN